MVAVEKPLPEVRDDIEFWDSVVEDNRERGYGGWASLRFLGGLGMPLLWGIVSGRGKNRLSNLEGLGWLIIDGKMG
jgi:hypothetical protein